jgi:hypothetical protein
LQFLAILGIVRESIRSLLCELRSPFVSKLITKSHIFSFQMRKPFALGKHVSKGLFVINIVVVGGFVMII